MKEVIGIIANFATVVAVVIGIIQYKLEQKRKNRLATIEAYDRLQKEVLTNSTDGDQVILRKQ